MPFRRSWVPQSVEANGVRQACGTDILFERLGDVILIEGPFRAGVAAHGNRILTTGACSHRSTWGRNLVPPRSHAPTRPCFPSVFPELKAAEPPSLDRTFNVQSPCVAARLVAFEEDEPLGRAAAEPVPGAEAGQILRPHRDDPLLSVLRASQMEPLLVEADVQPVEPDDLSDAEPLIEAQRGDRFEPDVEAGFLPGLDLLALATLEDAEKLSEFVFVDHLLGGLFLLLGIPDRLADIVFDPFPLLEPPEEHLAVAQGGALGLSRQLLSEAEVANVFHSDHAYYSVNRHSTGWIRDLKIPKLRHVISSVVEKSP